VAGWCESHAPVKWNGRRVENRNADGTVTWSTEGLITQCFGLGAERHLTTEQCQQINKLVQLIKNVGYGKSFQGGVVSIMLTKVFFVMRRNQPNTEE